LPSQRLPLFGGGILLCQPHRRLLNTLRCIVKQGKLPSHQSQCQTRQSYPHNSAKTQNVVLIEADSADRAREAARDVAQAEAMLDDEVTVDGQPAQRFFAGIRKVMTVQNPASSMADQVSLTAGTEVTYSL
jgi:hypothetical protein